MALPVRKDDGGSAVLPKILPLPSEKEIPSGLRFGLVERGRNNGSVPVMLELPLNGSMSMSSSSLSVSASDGDGPLLLVLEVAPGLRDPEGRKMKGPSDGFWFWVRGMVEFGLEVGGCVLEEEEEEEEEDGELVGVRGVPKVDDETVALGEDDVVFNGDVALI